MIPKLFSGAEMKIKRIVSLTAALSFVLVVLNSVALYIAPHGRVTRWVDWRFLGLTSTEWANQHIIVGLLFLIALSWHLYYNWTPIVAYLKNKAKRITVFTSDFNIALVLIVVFTVGAYVEIAPFSWVLDFSEYIKAGTAQKQGDPPFGRAEEATLEAFVTQMGWNLQETLVRLEQAGIKVGDLGQSLLQISRLNQTSPQGLYAAMQPDESTAAAGAVLPEDPLQGFGRLSLSEVCIKYGLDIAVIRLALEARNLPVTPASTIKVIAENHGLTPSEVYATIKGTADRTWDNPNE